MTGAVRGTCAARWLHICGWLPAQHCPLLDELNLSSSFPLTAAAVARTLRACPRIRVLHLTKCDHMFADPVGTADLMSAIADPASVRPHMARVSAACVVHCMWYRSPLLAHRLRVNSCYLLTWPRSCKTSG